MSTKRDGLAIAVDVGNSRIKFGLFHINGDMSAGNPLPACLHSQIVPLGDPIDWSLMQSWPEVQRTGSVVGVVAGANPVGVDKVVSSWPASLGPSPQILSDSLQFPLQVGVHSPRQVGIDRLLNAVAANAIRSKDRPAVIVDSGTATTVDYVTRDGAFAGGAILPGFDLCSRALHQYTALLPQIDIREFAETPTPVGNNTRDALRSGLFWGQLGGVSELVDQICRHDRELHGLPDEALSTDAPVWSHVCLLVTGGGASLLARGLGRDLQVFPHLSLQGLVMTAGHVFAW